MALAPAPSGGTPESTGRMACIAALQGCRRARAGCPRPSRAADALACVALVLFGSWRPSPPPRRRSCGPAGQPARPPPGREAVLRVDDATPLMTESLRLRLLMGGAGAPRAWPAGRPGAPERRRCMPVFGRPRVTLVLECGLDPSLPPPPDPLRLSLAVMRSSGPAASGCPGRGILLSRPSFSKYLQLPRRRCRAPPSLACRRGGILPPRPKRIASAAPGRPALVGSQLPKQKISAGTDSPPASPRIVSGAPCVGPADWKLHRVIPDPADVRHPDYSISACLPTRSSDPVAAAAGPAAGAARLRTPPPRAAVELKLRPAHSWLGRVHPRLARPKAARLAAAKGSLQPAGNSAMCGGGRHRILRRAASRNDRLRARRYRPYSPIAPSQNSAARNAVSRSSDAPVVRICGIMASALSPTDLTATAELSVLSTMDM